MGRKNKLRKESTDDNVVEQQPLDETVDPYVVNLEQTEYMENLTQRMLEVFNSLVDYRKDRVIPIFDKVSPIDFLDFAQYAVRDDEK